MRPPPASPPRPRTLATLATVAAVCALSAGAAPLLVGCPMPPTTAARMQEAANDLNTDARFGRLEIAVERVAPSARDSFLEHHRAWGSAVRIADFELVGARMTAEEEADVTVRVAWYRPEEQDLRVTTVRQHWHDQKGSWLLTNEARVDGEAGLLGEPVAREAPREPRRNAQFPTIRIGASSP